MADAVLIEAARVGKRYCRSLRQTLFYGFQDGLKRAIGLRTDRDALRADEFWAVRDISFQLRRGDCLGVIGPNGAGKSTLLKMLDGSVLADCGQVRIAGRIGAMVDADAGLSPLLSGSENLFAYAARQGFDVAAARAAYDAVVDFADLHGQMDKPVKHYSSGMQMRLAFSLLAHFPADAILLDEVLATGDARFRAKCLNRIPQLLQHSAIVFVSHSMSQIARICTAVLVLDKGKSLFYGREVPLGMEAYYAVCETDVPAMHSGTGQVCLHETRLLADGEPLQGALAYGQSLTLELVLECGVTQPATLSITLTNPELHNIAQCDSAFSGFCLSSDVTGRTQKIRAALGALHLNPGLYFLSLTVTDSAGGGVLLRSDNFAKLRVTGEHVGHAPLQIVGDWRLL